ncbi:DctP family TRAP transporter solute-binding subunit [Ramlibacter sp. MAHUQ-53]|uniref:DctP family TRAP transporter solute-binding subunit n=1 Tax=unclassified Ramlibacter TaxID=2617605 RepID=UPI00363EE329
MSASSPRIDTRRRRQLLRAGAAACAGALAPSSHGASRARPILVEFSHVVSADTAKGRAALYFKALAEARTGGRVRVEVHPDSTLYKDREELEALRMGAVQMLAPSLSKLSALGIGDFEVFDLPFLFRDQAAFRAVADGALGAGLLQRLAPLGLQGLCYWDNGFKVFTANRPIHGPGDVRGLKVRVQASRTLVEQMRTLGAQVSVSPLANVFESLRTGQLDGQENVPSNIHSQRLHEAQSHLSVTRHGYLAYAVLTNRRFWERLPDDIRQHLQAALREATRFANQIAEAENHQALERIAASGRVTMFTPSPLQLRQWREALAPVDAATRGWIDPQLAAAFRRAGAPPP